MNNPKAAELGKHERNALEGFFKDFLPTTKTHKYTFYYTPDNTYSVYDCLAKQFNIAENKVTKKMFFEVKVRDTYYSTLLLEKKKFESLKSLIRDSAVDKIYYINFTPKGTVVFDLLKIEAENKLLFIQQEHNIQTMNKDLGKVLKEIAYIDITDGKFFEYVFVPITGNIMDALPEDFEAFPLEDEIKPVENKSNQTELKLETPDTIKIVRDEEGFIVFNKYTDFARYPQRIQWEYVYQQRVKRWLEPGEDYKVMLEENGGWKELGEFLYKRFCEKPMTQVNLKLSNQYHLMKAQGKI